MPWGTVVGGIASGALSGGGAMAASHASAKAAKKSYQNRYQWTRKDLEAAGFNPMLAMSQGAPVPNQPHIENAGAAAAEGFGKATNALVQKKLADSAVEKNAAESEKARAEAAQATSAAAVNAAMVPEIAARTELHGANARELASRIQYQQSLLPEVTARIENIKADTAKKSVEIQKYKAEMAKIASEIGKNESEIRWNDLNFHQKSRLFPLVQSAMQSEAWMKYYSIPESKYRYDFWRNENEGKDLGDYRWWKSMGTQMGPFSSAAGVAGFLK